MKPGAVAAQRPARGMTPGSPDDVRRGMMGAVPDSEPSPDRPSPDRPPAVAPAPADRPVLPLRSLDDSDTGWGERDEPDDDERLRQDRPPHWDPR